MPTNKRNKSNKDNSKKMTLINSDISDNIGNKNANTDKPENIIQNEINPKFIKTWTINDLVQTILAIATFLTLIFYISFTSYQISLTKQAIEDNKRSNMSNDSMRRKELRAYIVIASDAPVFEDSIIRCKLYFVNNGKTPARDIEIYGGIYSNFLPYGFNPSMIKSRQQNSIVISQDIIDTLANHKTNIGKNIIMGSNNSFQYEMTGWPGGKNYKILQDFIKRGIRPLFLCGKIKYWDVFNYEHSYQFCFIYNPEEASFSVYEKFNFFD